MKTLIFNTFSTFPMFNPAYLKGFLLRDGIECEHIDINQIVCSKLLSKDFLQSLVFNKNNVSSTNSEQCKRYCPKKRYKFLQSYLCNCKRRKPRLLS